MDRIRMGRRLALSLGTSALLVGAIAGPAIAADTVVQAVNAGTRTASVATTMGPVTHSYVDQHGAGTMTLAVGDNTGSNLGWNVTIEVSAFSWLAVNGSQGGVPIPAVNFSITSADDPHWATGQAVDQTTPFEGGPYVTASPTGALNGPVKTVSADAAFGNGTYTQVLAVDLLIPAFSAAGTYTGTLTTTISAAP